MRRFEVNMLFSSIVFVLFFLPFNIIVTRFLPVAKSNIFLLATSLIFYAWGEPVYILLMLFSITANWLFGLWINKAKGGAKNFALVAALLTNLGLLFYYKYFNFAVGVAGGLLGIDTSAIHTVALPLGISFYTFQALSYIIDVYRGRCEVQPSWIKLSLYISFFPQLVAGPIVRYNDINEQLTHRTISWDKTAYGLKRFVYGLGKKVIISNYFGQLVDIIYGLPAGDIPTPLAWLVALMYALQIYYDFSGYSDMAIGLGAIFGFDFIENFNYPFISASVQEFWRRWHISLSTWFREYLYIPLGGNRKGLARTYINLFIVFFATGFWHGASFQFIAWGLVHGMFMVLERAWLGKYLSKKYMRIPGFIYTFTEVIATFVIFRAPGLRYALSLIKSMFIPTAGSAAVPLMRYVDAKTAVMLVVAVALSGFVQQAVPKIREYLYAKTVGRAELVYLTVIYFWCIVLLVSNTYNPFIYFRF